MEIMRVRSQLFVWTSMSAAQGLIPVILMPSVSMSQEALPASAKQGTLVMEVTVKVSLPIRFAGFVLIPKLLFSLKHLQQLF
jgi:hypothetical protein